MGGLVYDCFMFFNELDLLDIRFNELDSVVDKFVLVECTKTHSLNDKPLYFQENKERYAQFKDKIIHVVVEDMPQKIEYQHHIDNFHRGCILRGLKDATSNDLILVSDLDEIPDSRLINLEMNTPSVFSHSNFGYALNIKVESPFEMAHWLGTVALRYTDLEDMSLQEYRESRKIIAQTNLIEGGWHYSYVSDAQTILHKLQSFSHTEILEQNPNLTEELIQHCIDNNFDFLGWFRYPPMGIQYKKYTLEDVNPPRYVLENQHKFGHLIR
jgi:beta-1,4-mannosyl-glycoprotein beta-1,4-N-acetylglucosaminyltransferase